MLGRAVQLEDFDTALSFEPAIVEGEAPDIDRVAVFDEGYAAGWEAARKAQDEEAEAVRIAAHSHLQDLSFTFQEARAHVMRALHPMLRAVMETAVPEAMRATLGHRLAAEIGSLAEEVGEAPVALAVAPADAPHLAGILDEVTALPVTLREDPGLAAGQMHLHLGRAAREIDLTELKRVVNNALSALDTINEEHIAHG